MSAPERAALVRQAAEKIRQRTDHLARLQTREMGRRLAGSIADMHEVAFAFDDTSPAW